MMCVSWRIKVQGSDIYRSQESAILYNNKDLKLKISTLIEEIVAVQFLNSLLKEIREH